MDTFIPSRTSMNACPVRTWGSGNEEGEPRLSAGGDHLSMEAPRELALTPAAPGWGTSGQGRYRTPPPATWYRGAGPGGPTLHGLLVALTLGQEATLRMLFIQAESAPRDLAHTSSGIPRA